MDVMDNYFDVQTMTISIFVILGSRFALMQIKAILYNLLLNFSFEANEKTEIPLKLKKSPFSLNPENGMFLELKPRQK